MASNLERARAMLTGKVAPPSTPTAVSVSQPLESETVKQAEALGVFTGREGNLFDPQARITRGETAVVLYRSLDKLELLDNN